MLRGYLLVVGLVLVTCAAVTALKQARSLSHWVGARGVVVGSAKQSDGEGASAFFARIAFSTGEGARFEFVSRVGGSIEPARGRIIAIKYDPYDPRRAVEDSFVAHWGFPLTLCGLGFVSLIAALLSDRAV